jgi:hypothetical protein
MTMFSKWYQDTALEDFTRITASKLNSANLGAVMDTTRKLVPEGIVGLPLTSNKAKNIVEESEITEKNELIRQSGLVYYEDQRKTLFDIPGRAIVCFNHTDLEQERSTRLKKIAVSEDKVARILKADGCNKNSDCQEIEIKAAIKGVSIISLSQIKIGK